MDERSTKVGELLHEAAETHHQVFRITDGADDDWASWYSEWLVRLSELPELLGAELVRSELTYMLVRLDKEYTERHLADRWEDYYAASWYGSSAHLTPDLLHAVVALPPRTFMPRHVFHQVLAVMLAVVTPIQAGASQRSPSGPSNRHAHARGPG